MDYASGLQQETAVMRKGWFLVQNPPARSNWVTLHSMEPRTQSNQAIRCYGRADISFLRNQKHRTSPGDPNGRSPASWRSEDPAGIDISLYGFRDIGQDWPPSSMGPDARGVFEENLYFGKGDGDWLDYAVEVGAGSILRESQQNSIFSCRGTCFPPTGSKVGWSAL